MKEWLRRWLRFTPPDLAVITLVGLLTPLLNERVEALVNPPLFSLQDALHVYYYVGGPLVGDLGLVWLQYGAVLAAYVVRKPGAATIAMTINGFVQVFVRGIHAPHLLYGVTGLGADITFSLYGDERYDARTCMLAGIACEVFWYPIVYFTHFVYLFPVPFVIFDFILRIPGSAIGDGLVGAALGFILLLVVRKVEGLEGPHAAPRSSAPDAISVRPSRRNDKEI